MGGYLILPGMATAATFGTINNPLNSGNTGPGGGLIVLLNNVLRLMFAGAGIFAFIQIVLAGFNFISAGSDAKKIEQAWNSIYMSIIGLIVVVMSIAIAGLMGLILFGDAGAILNPSVYGPGKNVNPQQ